MHKNFKLIFCAIALLTLNLAAAVKSTTNEIKFDVNSDSTPEMVLNSTGLGIGASTFSSNLYVSGNAIVTGTMVVGGTTNDSGSNLHVHGSIAYSVLSYAAGGNAIGNTSMVMVDTSAGNAQVQLPIITDGSPRMITIKRTSNLNDLYISGAGNTMDGYSTFVFPSGNLTSLSLYNDGSNWYVISNANDETLAEVGSDNLFAWWRLEETSGNVVTDSSSAGTRGANLTNEHSFSGNSITGATNSGLEMEDFSDSVLYEAGSLPTGAYSYSLWVKYNHGSSETVDYDPEIEGSAGFVWASSNAMFHKSSYHRKLDGTYITTPLLTDLSADTWYNIAVTWDGTTMNLYLNGAFQSGNALATDWASGTNISLTNPGLFSTSIVDVDEMRFYTDVLSADEIKALSYTGH
jgi:hypothetical protein